MQLSDLPYFIILLIGLLLAFIANKKKHSSANYLFLLFLFTLAVEIWNYIAFTYKVKGFGFIIYLFNPIEYSLFILYFIKNVRLAPIKRIAQISIPVFTCFSLSVAIFLYHLKGFPSLNIEIEGFLLFVSYACLLFNLDDTRAIQRLPDFWIAIGVLLFFGGVFAFVGIYPILAGINPLIAFNEYSFIIRPLNVVLYICIVIGLICLIHGKSSSIRLS